MDITLTIPADRLPEVLQAFGESYGNGSAPLTEAQLQQVLTDFLNNTVKAAAVGREIDQIRSERTAQIAEAKVQERFVPIIR